MDEESMVVEEHPEGCACGCDDMEPEDYVKEAEEARLKNDCTKRWYSQCDCPLCKEVIMGEETKAQSYVDKGLEHIEGGLKSAGAATGKVVGKAAWFFMKPLDQVHKHVIEPFTDAFTKAFTDGK